MARGNGIKVVNKWAQIPKNAPMIVQRYIARPHLINGTKYDLRIYVLVTSINPLVVYLYDEGLVRFASNKGPLTSDPLPLPFSVFWTDMSSGGTGVLYAKNQYIGHPLFYSKFGSYSIQI